MAIPAIFRNPIITSSSGESSVVFSYNAQAQCLQGYGTERLSALLAQMRRREELDYPDARYDPPWRDTIVYSIDRPTWESHP